MSKSKKRAKRRRTVPRNIGEKTGREIMEAVFGKRVAKRLDAELAEPENHDEPSMHRS